MSYFTLKYVTLFFRIKKYTNADRRNKMFQNDLKKKMHLIKNFVCPHTPGVTLLTKCTFKIKKITITLFSSSCTRQQSTRTSWCSELWFTWSDHLPCVLTAAASLWRTQLTVSCLLFTVYCTLYTIYCKLYTIYCKLYTIHCILYTIYCFRFTATFELSDQFTTQRFTTQNLIWTAGIYTQESVRTR